MPDPRTFIRVHDGLDENAKIEALSDAAFRLLVSTWCYCSRNLNDGLIAEAAWSRRGAARARRELEVEMVHRPGHRCSQCETVPAGFVRMHDYIDSGVLPDRGWQRSAADVADYKDKKSRAGRKSAEVRARVTTPAATGVEQVLEHEPNRTATSTETETERTPPGDRAARSRAAKAPQNGDGSPAAQQLVGAFVDLHTRRPPDNVVGQVARHVKGLLAEGFEPDLIRTSLTDLVRRQLNPSTLPSLVNQHANQPTPVVSNVPSWEMTT